MTKLYVRHLDFDLSATRNIRVEISLFVNFEPFLNIIGTDLATIYSLRLGESVASATVSLKVISNVNGAACRMIFLITFHSAGNFRLFRPVGNLKIDLICKQRSLRGEYRSLYCTFRSYSGNELNGAFSREILTWSRHF